MYANIEAIARDAGKLALDYFDRLSSLPVEAKGHLDLVTLADRDVEEFITHRLQDVCPGDGIFGEEGSAIEGTTGRTWVIDPIDGTFNFVRGGDQWAISIGLFENGRPVFGTIYAPLRNQMLVGGCNVPAKLNGTVLPPRNGLDRSRASVGVGFHPVVPTQSRLDVLRFIIDDARMVFRCCGSATISLLEVASGEVDGYVGIGESSWDVMAALPILEQLGVESTIDWSTQDLKSKLQFACGTPEFLSIIAPIMPNGALLNS